jgi:predicted metal-dependent hydrolase
MDVKKSELYRSLWSSCDELRGGMDASHYKDYVLTLLFVKYVWGSCNTSDHRVWLNLELAKKPLHCLEYVLVHEMVHLLERQHTERFKELMDKFLPHWRLYREELNQTPLAHEEWAT